MIRLIIDTHVLPKDFDIKYVNTYTVFIAYDKQSVSRNRVTVEDDEGYVGYKK